MCARDRPSADDLVIGSEDVVNFELESQKARSEAKDHALEPLSAADEVG
jgi:hypothetical protein